MLIVRPEPEPVFRVVAAVPRLYPTPGLAMRTPVTVEPLTADTTYSACPLPPAIAPLSPSRYPLPFDTIANCEIRPAFAFKTLSKTNCVLGRVQIGQSNVPIL